MNIGIEQVLDQIELKWVKKQAVQVMLMGLEQTETDSSLSSGW